MGDAGRVFGLCLSLTRADFHFDIINILGCRPWKLSERGNITNRAPSQKEIDACLPRVKHVVRDFPYDGYVHLGDIPKKALPLPGSIKLKHPAAIYRMEYKLYDIREFALELNNYVTHISNARNQDPDGR